MSVVYQTDLPIFYQNYLYLQISDKLMQHTKIKELRLKNNFTQEQMAEELHISQNAYSLIENGKTKLMNAERIEIIAKKFNVNPLDLGLFDGLGALH